MSEYIVRETGYPGTIKQEIVSELVRCRDCRYYMRSDELCEMIAARLHLYECGKQWNEDSFCCWGKRRGEEDE